MRDKSFFFQHKYNIGKVSFSYAVHYDIVTKSREYQGTGLSEIRL